MASHIQLCPYDLTRPEEATKVKTTLNHDLAPIGQIKNSLGESSLGVAALGFSERYLSN